MELINKKYIFGREMKVDKKYDCMTYKNFGGNYMIFILKYDIYFEECELVLQECNKNK